jgi:hypothetical protein
MARGPDETPMDTYGRCRPAAFTPAGVTIPFCLRASEWAEVRTRRQEPEIRNRARALRSKMGAERVSTKLATSRQDARMRGVAGSIPWRYILSPRDLEVPAHQRDSRRPDVGPAMQVRKP